MRLRPLRFAPLCLLISLLGAAEPPAAVPADDRITANTLRIEQRYEEARQLFERWSAAHPKDGEGVFDVAYTLYLQACAEADATRGNALRKQARALIAQARSLGCTNVLLTLEASIGPAGEDLRTFHASPAVADIMRRAELAFSQHRHDEALHLYAEARTLDPRCYQAALFTGDVYFGRQEFARADEWFARAVAIDADIETAHRYWGDSLARQRRFTEARDRYIDALIAEPYNRIPREMLTRFAGASYKKRSHINTQLPMTRVEWKEQGPHLDYAAAPGAVTLAYGLARARWLEKERTRYFPKDATPRHSLPEEVAGLRTWLQVAQELEEKDAAAVAPWKEAMAELAQLERAGLLEAFILIDRADQGIAQDYANYRRQQRDQLVRYVRLSWFSEP